MTRNQALLLQVAEEAAVVAQAASKCIRFGSDHVREPRGNTSASLSLYQEILDLLAVIEMCQAAGLIQDCDYDIDREKIEAKKLREEEFLALSCELGCVDKGPIM